MDARQQALAYAQAGFSVVPIGHDKRPLIPWKEFQNRIATPEEISHWPDGCGIGTVCGAISGNLEVLDFDIPDRKETVEFVETFLLNVVSTCENLGIDSSPLDDIAIISTPGGGAHLYYRCREPVCGSTKLARNSGKRDPQTGDLDGKPGYFIETRGEGGYVVAPGSPGHCHPSGRIYQHETGTKLEELPQTMTHQLRDVMFIEATWLGVDGLPYSNAPEMQADRKQQAAAMPKLATVERTRRELTETPGDDFSRQVSWHDILTPHGFEYVGRDGSTDRWKRPGTESALSATTNHDESDLFYAFSPNCHPLIEPQRGYSKFAVYAFLYHNGDFSEATRELSRKGFGKTADIPESTNLSSVLQSMHPAQLQEGGEDMFPFESMASYLSCDEEVGYHCRDIVASGQVMILAGPQKSMKTCLAIALAIGMASGRMFLGRFHCPKPVPVGILTGESSRAKNQAIMRAIHAARYPTELDAEKPLSEIQFHICHRLPVFSNPEHLANIRNAIYRLGFKVLIIDPAYLCLGDVADSTANVAKMGNLLRAIGDLAASADCTLIILHHTNRKFDEGKPLSLHHLSGAGWAEWARQWMLVNPRIPFDTETSTHRLWMVTGGSDGHSGTYAVDIRERDDEGNWIWVTDVRSLSEEIAEYKEAKQERREERKSAKEEQFHTHLREALQQAGEDGATLNEIANTFRDNGWSGAHKLRKPLMEDFVENDFVTLAEGRRGNGQRVAVYAIGRQWCESAVAQIDPETGFE